MGHTIYAVIRILVEHVELQNIVSLYISYMIYCTRVSKSAFRPMIRRYGPKYHTYNIIHNIWHIWYYTYYTNIVTRHPCIWCDSNAFSKFAFGPTYLIYLCKYFDYTSDCKHPQCLVKNFVKIQCKMYWVMIHLEKFLIHCNIRKDSID